MRNQLMEDMSNTSTYYEFKSVNEMLIYVEGQNLLDTEDTITYYDPSNERWVLEL